jgi:hypothetical protein
LNHEYVAALEIASAQLVENGPATPPPEETTMEEHAAIWEEAMKKLEAKAIREAAIEAEGVSDEGEGVVAGEPETMAW